MVFVVGGSLIVLGALVAWGGISGRLAKMIAAMFPTNNPINTTTFSQPTGGYEQLTGLTLGSNPQ